MIDRQYFPRFHLLGFSNFFKKKKPEETSEGRAYDEDV